jgi:hypothetical protein
VFNLITAAAQQVIGLPIPTPMIVAASEDESRGWERLW